MAPQRHANWLSTAAVVATGCWVLVVTVVLQAGGWLLGQYTLIEELRLPIGVPVAVSLLNALLVIAPAALLQLLALRPALRTASRAWLLSGLALAVLCPVRAVPAQRPAAGAAAAAVLSGLVVLAVWLYRRRRPTDPQPQRPGAVLLAAAAGVLMLLPWAYLGALGDLTDSVTALLAAAGLGALAGTVLTGRFWAAFSDGPRWRRILGGGAAATVALAPLAAGIGQGGVQLALLGTMPVLGFTVAALNQRAGTAVGLAAVGPLAFVAPVQLTPLLGARDIDRYAALATGAGALTAMLIALVGAVGAVGLRMVGPGRIELRRPLAAAVTALAVLATGTVYLTLGHPGAYGDRLLVVLRTQADLTGLRDSEAAGAAGRTGRVAAVYRRLVDTATRSQRPLRHALQQKGVGFTPYYLVDAIEVDGSGPLLQRWLSEREDVAKVVPNPRLRPLPAPPTPEHGTAPEPTGTPWNLTAIGADRVVEQLHVDGHGIVVGSSDSGADGHHPALRAGFRGGDDSWYDPWYASTTPTDYQGHGTHTLASAVGRGVDGTPAVGVAPGAKWIGCVDLARNLGNPAYYLDCLQFMLAPFPTGGNPFTDGDPARAPQILTNSWSCAPVEGCAADTLRPATRAFAAAGIFVVAAAGNAGPRCGSLAEPPGRYPDVLTVGAVDRRGRVAAFSSRGPVPGGGVKPDLVAPGVDITSALPGGGYGVLAGTSMATPQVAGVVALMWSANPRLVGDLATTTRLLRRTAVPASGATSCGAGDGSGAGSGAGLVDAYAAVRAAQRLR